MRNAMVYGVGLSAALLLNVADFPLAHASSHMDAPLISLDDPANTTDVYAFVSKPAGGMKYLTTALSVYPFEEPGIGPNNYRFDPTVVYKINVAFDDNIAKGKSDVSYRVEFDTNFANKQTILQSYLGVLNPAGKGAFPDNQNLRQTYTVWKVEHVRGKDVETKLGGGNVPPNNQGRVTPFYNQGDDGDMPARPGVADAASLDRYTQQAIFDLDKGYQVFAGQRDDGFYADIQSIFDLDFTFGTDRGTPTKPFDSQSGFNVHTIVINIPFKELDGAKIAGVYATTWRRMGGESLQQIARQGNPLFNEALIAIADKNKYGQGTPDDDEQFRRYAKNPELSRVLSAKPIIPGLLESIFIPDLIKVDLTTPPARLAGGAGFNRLSVFGNDVLKSSVQDPFKNGGFIPGGWPNGRRFGDDVLDIAVIALGLAGPGPDFSAVNVDGVTSNDITYNDVFPYAATPLNGRVHEHNGSPVAAARR